MRTYLTRLLERRAAAVSFVQSLTDTAAAANRDLTEPEMELIRGRRTEVDELNAQIVPLREFDELVERTDDLDVALDDRPVRPVERSAVRRDAPPAEPVYRSAGHYVLDVMRARSIGDRAALERITRAAAAAGIERAAATITTADIPGFVPPAYTRDVIAVIDTTRPFITAMNTRPLPASGMQVIDPVVTQRPAVGVQAAEKTEIATRKVTIGNQTYNVLTYAGYDNVSIQAIERSDPDFLNELFLLFADEYATETDTAAITAAITAGTAGPTVPTAPDPGDWTAAFTQAAAMVYTGVKRPADRVVLAVDSWAAIASLTDTTGRPLFPASINGPVNALGQSNMANTLAGSGNLLGLQPVVDPNAPAGTIMVCWSGAFRTMESPGAPVQIRALEVSILGYEVGVYGFAAFAPRQPAGIVRVGHTDPFAPVGLVAGDDDGGSTRSSGRKGSSSSSGDEAK
jgi:HK97 family phage major capsid protein